MTKSSDRRDNERVRVMYLGLDRIRFRTKTVSAVERLVAASCSKAVSSRHSHDLRAFAFQEGIVPRPHVPLYLISNSVRTLKTG